MTLVLRIVFVLFCSLVCATNPALAAHRYLGALLVTKRLSVLFKLLLCGVL